MKITIVVPVYNVEAYIEDCLKSIAAQTYKGKLECIIVDDCTQDNSCAVIEHFIKEYKGTIEFKLLHHNVNRGLSAARNTGIDAATGEYIYFLDSDDEITPDCIELLAEPLKRTSYDFIIGDYTANGNNDEIAKLLLAEGEIINNYNIRKQFFWGQWYMMAWNKLCNLDFIRKEELFFEEGIINEDNLWSFKLSCTAKSMYVIKKGTYKYNVRRTSIMGHINSIKTAFAYTTIARIAYCWSKDRNKLQEDGVIHQILYYRNFVLKCIFEQSSYKERKILYLKLHRGIRINILKHSNKQLTKKTKFRELYNYMPGILGFWFLSFCQRFLGERFLSIA